MEIKTYKQKNKNNIHYSLRSILTSLCINLVRVDAAGPSLKSSCN